MTRAQRAERAFAVPMIIAALLVVPLLALENADLGGAWPAILTVGDWAIWTAFVAEAIVMLRVVPDRGAWLRDHPLEVIVIVFSFPLLSSAFAAIRVLRVLRLVRLLRLAKLARVAFSMTGLRYVTLLAVLTVIAGGERSRSSKANRWQTASTGRSRP